MSATGSLRRWMMRLKHWRKLILIRRSCWRCGYFGGHGRGVGGFVGAESCSGASGSFESRRRGCNGNRVAALHLPFEKTALIRKP